MRVEVKTLYLAIKHREALTSYHTRTTHPLQSCTNDLSPFLSAERLWSLDGSTDCAVNDELGKDTNGAGDTKENSVVVGLGQSIVLQEDSRVGIDIGVGVLGLSVLSQDTRGNLVDLADELEHGVIGEMLLSKGPLGHVAGVGLAENGVAISRNNLARLKGGPQVVTDGFVAEIVANRSLHFGEPVQHLLVSETVEGAGKTIKTSGEGEHGGAESASNQVGSVGADIATLVVSVDGEVQSHQLDKVLVVAKAQLVGKVEAVVLILLDGSDLSALENVLVDPGGDRRELCDQVHRILEGVSPVFGLLHALGVGLGKGGFVLESVDSDGELCHWVKVAWAAVDQLLNKFGDVRTGGPFGREVADLLLAGDFASQQKPEETCEAVSTRCDKPILSPYLRAEAPFLLELLGEAPGTLGSSFL